METFIYKGAYYIWNLLIYYALNFFTINPMKANSTVSGVASSVYEVFLAIAVPLCAVFFCIAIAREVIESPPEHQLRKLFSNGLKFAIILGLIVNLWSILGSVMGITQEITGVVASKANLNKLTDMTYAPDISQDNSIDAIGSGIAYAMWFNGINIDMPSDLEACLQEVQNMGLDTNGLFCHIGSFIMAIVTLFIMVASGITIISCGIQRIIKPLIILPFSSVALATGAGSGEISRVMSQFFKSFLGLLLSGTFMVICIKMGSALTEKMILFDETAFASMETSMKIILLTLQSAVGPVVIAGLVKGVDALIGKFL